jgi:hypothetical protein
MQAFKTKHLYPCNFRFFVNKNADKDLSVLCLSMDVQARVKIGSFDRGGKSRTSTEADDHDYNPIRFS